jgi:hypothetical protein
VLCLSQLCRRPQTPRSTIDGLGGSAFCGWLLVAVLAGFGVLGWLSALGTSAATIALRWLAECCLGLGGPAECPTVWSFVVRRLSFAGYRTTLRRLPLVSRPARAISLLRCVVEPLAGWCRCGVSAL